jgi:hypothetical protein
VTSELEVVVVSVVSVVVVVSELDEGGGEESVVVGEDSVGSLRPVCTGSPGSGSVPPFSVTVPGSVTPTSPVGAASVGLVSGATASPVTVDPSPEVPPVPGATA